MNRTHGEIWPIACALALLLAGLAIRVIAAWQDVAYLIESHPTQVFLIDDSFLSHNIARNLALGRGMTFDGVHVTNGFQPLYVFLLVPLYHFLPDDRLLPIHIALTFLAVANILCGWLIYRTARLFTSAEAALLGLAVWALSPDVVRLGINGLETSLSLLFIAWSLYFYLRRIRLPGGARARDFIVLGLLLGLAIFSRLDSGLFALALGLDMLYLGIKRRRFVRALGHSCLAAVVALVIISPWLAVSLGKCGSIMPVSGKAVRFASLDKFGHKPPPDYYLNNVYHSLATIFDNPGLPAWRAFRNMDYDRPEALGVAVNLPLFLMLWVLLWRRGAESSREMGAPVGHLGFLLPYALLSIAAYSFYVLGQWFYTRYYYPLLYMVLLFVVIGLGALFHALKDRPLAKEALALVMVTLISGGFVIHWKAIINRGSGCGYLSLSEWLDANVPQEMVIGAFQSGALGYFLDHRVVNLDGVVNESALLAMEGEEMYAYLLKDRVEVIADWGWVVDVSLRRNSKKRRPRLHHVADTCGGSIFEVLGPGRRQSLQAPPKAKEKVIFQGDRL